jgi:DHHC palmitoyltransferase
MLLQSHIDQTSKHCTICNKCVVGFDHHCVWLNCCIAAANYRHFFNLLVSASVLLIVQIATAWLALTMSLRAPDFSRHNMQHWFPAQVWLIGIQVSQASSLQVCTL